MIELIVVGTSAGGLNALEVLLKGLPKSFSAAMAIVQHRDRHLGSQLCQVLGRYCLLPLTEPEDKELILPGRVYLAPADYHLLVEAGRGGSYFTFSHDAPVWYSRPAIDVLFKSAAYAYRQKLVGIILTGANHDGAQGIVTIKQYNGLTIAQEPTTAYSPIMPEAAIATGAVDWILPLEAIAPFLLKIWRSPSNCNLSKDI
ncbi:chemotaxis protein CheB [Aliterella atlantica]|uniref:protein-glutamate methylesterase n=1 Tax=Aliterella atlantica CENA595 TaxID=1618023 RepID=A0A0D8ZYY4_9CYAN|nr:chemotaxis protein CheB [Aliterella atlantica]KJH72416.1 chemotaxis protein [Aliterella atlantica CENA595]